MFNNCFLLSVFVVMRQFEYVTRSFKLDRCFSQQDSQEFLRFFMEGLHEDLNTGKKGKRKIEEPPKGYTWVMNYCRVLTRVVCRDIENVIFKFFEPNFQLRLNE